MRRREDEEIRGRISGGGGGNVAAEAAWGPTGDGEGGGASCRRLLLLGWWRMDLVRSVPDMIFMVCVQFQVLKKMLLYVCFSDQMFFLLNLGFLDMVCGFLSVCRFIWISVLKKN